MTNHVLKCEFEPQIKQRMWEETAMKMNAVHFKSADGLLLLIYSFTSFICVNPVMLRIRQYEVPYDVFLTLVVKLF